MAVSYDIYTTSTTAEITFHGMYSDGYSQYKQLQIWLDNSFVEWTEELDFTWITDYTYTYTGLSPNTSYNFEVDVFTDEGDGWRQRYTISGSFTTESGGGGGDNPYFEALVQGGTNIYVIARNLPSDYYRVQYGISSDSYDDDIEVAGGSHTFENLPDGEYRVIASYTDNYGDIHTLYTEDGYRAIFLTIGGGGGGGENWNYTETSRQYIDSSSAWVPVNLTPGYGQFFGISFSTSGTVSIEAPSYSSAELFYTDGNYGFDSSDGCPYESGGYKASGSSYHSFSVVANTLYYIWAKCLDSGSTSNFDILVHMSGGGSDTWQLVDERIGTINSSFDLPYNNGLEGYHLYRFQFTPSSTTSITFSTTGGANVIGWLSRWYDQGSWDNTTGTPNDYIARDVSSGNLSITYNCSADYSYYLWVRTQSGSGYSGQITIRFGIGGGGGNWRYDQDDVQYEHTNVDTEFSEYVTLDIRVGSYFAVDFKYTNTATFAIVDSSNAYLYVTAGINGYNPTTGEPSDAIAGSGGTSLTTTVNAGTTYIVWVRGSTENVYGSVQIMVTPGQRWLVSTIYTTEISTSTVPVSFYLSAGYMYCIPVRFTQPCNARFYSTGGYNRVAWLTSSNNDIDRNTGTPNGTILASDTSGDGDYDFSYSVAATTYYFWVRSTSFNDTTLLSAYFKPQISSSGKVWIYTSYGWKQATPWIYTASGWKQATPWIYTANGWKQTI